MNTEETSSPSGPDWKSAAALLGAERVLVARPAPADWSLSAGHPEPRDSLYRRLLLERGHEGPGTVDTSLLGDVGRRIRASGVNRLLIVPGLEGSLVIAENPSGPLDDETVTPALGALAGGLLTPADLPGRLPSTGSRLPDAADLELLGAWLAEVAARPPQPLVSQAGAEALVEVSSAEVVAFLWEDDDAVVACWSEVGGGRSEDIGLSWPLPDDYESVAAVLDDLTARPPTAPWRIVTAERGTLAVAISPPPTSPRAVGALVDFLAFDLERGRTTREGRQRSLLEERVRIAGLIHDGVTQQVSNVVIQLQLLELASQSQDPERLADTLRSAREATAAALEELRSSLYELAPRMSHMEDLVPSLRQWCQDYAAQWGIGVSVEAVDDEVGQYLDTETGMLAYAVVQECLTNIRKHADAGEVVVKVDFEPGELVLTVTDDGVGFPENPGPAAGGKRMGLRILRDRVRTAGGRMDIASTPGEGAEVTVHLPRQ